MNPIYKFELTVNGTTQRAYPIYNNDFAIEYEKQSNQEFYRAKLSGKLTFVKDDFDFIVYNNNSRRAFDTLYGITISVSRDAGQTWTQIWTGEFHQTDCTFDEDNKNIVVTPTPKDKYDEVLAGLDKEFNLIELAPEIIEVQADKRPLIQVYTPGDTVVGCFLSGMWWEQECEPVDNVSQLVNHYRFSLNTTKRAIEISNRNPLDEEIPDAFVGNVFPAINDEEIIQNGGYEFVYTGIQTGGSYIVNMEIRDTGGNTFWYYQQSDQGNIPPVVGNYPFDPFPGSSVSYPIDVTIRDISVYARLLTDLTTSTQGVNTFALPSNDMVSDNRNYTRVTGYGVQGVIRFQAELTDSVTQWGLYQPGKYYKPPLTLSEKQMYPVARSAWNAISIWFCFSSQDFIIEPTWRSPLTLRHCYPIWSVISVLLKKIAPNLYHDINDSQFLYPWTYVDGNPIDSQFDVTLFFTPKSNVINSGYDQPAQQAKITLANVLNMLRDVYQCYWYISGGHLKIEHIKFFRNGGSYTTTPGIGVDLTQQIVTRNGLPWAYDTKKYQYEKPDMAARYQFRWMDDVTDMFEGLPIDILSNYVNKENIQEVNISNITSDFDYVLLNPSAVSQDGFVLLAAEPTVISFDKPTAAKLKYYDVTLNSQRYIMQNGFAAMYYGETEMYGYDMPASQYDIAGEHYASAGVKRLKTQNVTFPLLSEPQLNKLVKTSLGNGTIRKLSLSLTARTAKTTLCYDTE